MQRYLYNLRLFSTFVSLIYLILFLSNKSYCLVEHFMVQNAQFTVPVSFGFSYVRFSQLCAQAVRSGLKRDLQAEAEKRNAFTIKHIEWKDGKAVSKSFKILSFLKILASRKSSEKVGKFCLLRSTVTVFVEIGLSCNVIM